MTKFRKFFFIIVILAFILPTGLLLIVKTWFDNAYNSKKIKYTSSENSLVIYDENYSLLFVLPKDWKYLKTKEENSWNATFISSNGKGILRYGRRGFFQDSEAWSAIRKYVLSRKKEDKVSIVEYFNKHLLELPNNMIRKKNIKNGYQIEFNIKKEGYKELLYFFKRTDGAYFVSIVYFAGYNNKRPKYVNSIGNSILFKK